MKNVLIMTFVLLTTMTTGVHAQDSLNMHRVGALPVWESASSVAVSGDYAFVATGYTGIRIVNISNPAAPREAAAYTGTLPAVQITTQGNLAFVVTGTEFVILDISTPLNPQLLSSTETGAHAVFVLGNYAYLLRWDEPWESLTAVDITNPASPQLLGSFHVDGYKVVVRDHLAFVTANNEGLYIIDVSDPQNLSQVGHLTISWAVGIALTGNLACIADEETGFRAVDISDPANPVLAGACSIANWAHGVDARGNYAFVSDMGGVVHAIDLSNPHQPTEVATYSVVGRSASENLTLVDNLAFVAGGSSGLRIVNITDPTVLAEVGTFDPPNTIYDLAVSGNIVSVADGGNAVRFIDVSVPAAPVEVGYIPSQSLYSVAAAGRYAYSGEGDGLRVLDIADPTLPEVVGGLTLVGSPEDIAIADNHAYIAAFDATLRVLDVTDAEWPHVVAQIGTNGSGAVAAVGEYAYVVAYDGEYTHSFLKIFDIASPASPVETGSVALPQLGGSVAVMPGYAFVGCEQQVSIVNVSDPAHPQIVGSIAQTEYGKLTIAGRLLYVSTLRRLRVYDVIDPTSPQLIGYYDNQNHAYYLSTVILGDYIFAGGGSSFDVLQLNWSGMSPSSELQPTEFALQPAYPNPFNPSTTLTFSVPSNSQVTLNIYDMLGRLVGTPYRGNTIAGAHSVLFDGSHLAGGIYFARLQTPSSMMTQKLFLLK